MCLWDPPGVTSIGVHNLSPGMVLTDLLLKVWSECTGRRISVPPLMHDMNGCALSKTERPNAQDTAPGARRFFNALAEEPETVAAALAARLRAVQVKSAAWLATSTQECQREAQPWIMVVRCLCCCTVACVAITVMTPPLQGTGTSVEYLNPVSAVGRVLRRIPQIVRGGRFFDGQGRRVAQPGHRYADNGVRQLYEIDV